MDDYFGALDVQTTSGEEDRSDLLEGVTNELVDAANDAFAAIQTLKYSDLFMMEYWDERNDEVAAIYREFSQADLPEIQKMIDSVDRIWRTLQQNSKAELEQAEKRLEHWRGKGANAAKYYINQLADAYTYAATRLTVLESDVVAVRETIATARQDLENLSASFKSGAEQYVSDAEKAEDAKLYKVLAAGFAGAVTGLLAVASAGAGAAAGAAIFSAANGAMVAGHAAGAAISASLTESASVSGDSSMKVYQSFMDNVQKIRDGVDQAMSDLIAKIGEEIQQLPKIPAPPDVSPGDSFDPDAFETERLDEDREKTVRDAGVDIAPDGSVDSGGSAGSLGRL